MVGRPSAADFKRMVHVNILKNLSITDKDIRTLTRFFPDVGSLRGKKLRRWTDTVVSDYMAIPESIKEKMKAVNVTGGVKFVNKIPFFISLVKMLSSPESKT